MKLTFFTAYLGGTHGTAKSARDFLRALLACRDSVRVVSPSREQFPARLCDKDLGEVEWFDLPKRLQPSFTLRSIRHPKLKEWFKDQRAIQKLNKILSRDAVIVNGWASYGHWQLVKDLFKGPKIIIVRESPRHFSGPDRNEIPTDLLGGFSSFDHLIFVSDRVCREWLQYKELTGKSYSVLPNCCEEEELVQFAENNRDALRRQQGFRPEDFVILCPGTIEHRKGQDLLLDIVPSLKEQIPNLKVLLVGDAGTSWGKNLIRTIPGDLLGGTVVHWQSKPGIMDLLRAANLLAFPSRAEAMPRTILEAMVMKTPVVASNVDGIPELVVDGLTGLMFSKDDKMGLLNAVLHLHREPKFLKQLSESASERYWGHFSRRHQFDRMAIVLEEISQNSDSSD